MADEHGAPGSESGKEFREKFEATQAENAVLRSKIAEQLGVDAEVLKGVPADQIVDKALEAKRAQEAAEEAILRKHLGIGPNDDLAAALAKVKGEGTTQTQTQTPAPTPFTSTGALGGSPPSGRLETSGLSAVDRIAAALEGKKS